MASNPYGQKHKVERHKLKPLIDNGEGWCAEPTCLLPDRWIPPGTPWDLAHDRAATEQYGQPIYLGPAHQRCNRAEGARWRYLHATNPTSTSTNRRVVLICGPPGAGKSTFARTLGLEVYDRDNPRWGDHEAAFTAAVAELAANPDAQAAVIRSGATLTARDAAAQRIGATETRLILTPQETCIERVIKRNRPRPPMPRQIAAVRQWWRAYEPPPTPNLPISWVL